MTLYKQFASRVWHSPSAMSWAALVVRLGSFFIILPLVLNRFSSEEVSAWLLFYSIASMMLLADMGFSQTFSRDISYGFSGYALDKLFPSLKGEQFDNSSSSNGEENWTTISLIYQSMRWIYKFLALGALLVLATIGTWSIYTPVERTNSPTELFLAWGILITGNVISVYGYTFSAFLIGANQISKQKRWETLVITVGLGSQIIILLLHANLFILIVASQITLIAQVLANYFLVKNLTKTRLICNQTSIQKKIILDMWPTTWRTATGIFSSLGIMQGITIAIVNILPATEAASLQLSIRIMQTISQFSQIPFYTKIPRLNHLRSINKIQELSTLAMVGMRTSLNLFVIAALIINFTITPILTFIDSKTTFVSQKFWSILLLAYFFERYGAMHIQLFSTTRVIVWHIANGITGVIWIILMQALITHFGSNAMPLSMLIAYISFYSWYSALKSYNSLPNVSFYKFERKVSFIPVIILSLFTIYVFTFK